MYNTTDKSRKGLDVPVNRFVDYLNANLWAGLDYTAYGLAEIIERDDLILPEVYDSGINYSKIFLETGKASNSFFLIRERDRIDGLGSIKFDANLDLIFSINLVKIKPTITTYRAKEEAIDDIVKLIYSSDFFINSITQDLDAIDDFTLSNKVKRTMHPNLFLKFNINTIY